MHSHKNIHHPVIINCYGTVRSTMIMQKSPYLKQTVDTLKNLAITIQHLGGGEVGQGKSRCTRQIAQGYLQHL